MAILDFLKNRSIKKDPNVEMSFVDHLEELRWHLIRSIAAVSIASILVFSFSHFFIDEIIFGPTKPGFISIEWFCKLGRFIGIGDQLCFENSTVKFISTTMTGQFLATFTVAFVGGFILAFPYIVWEFWRFVKPALSENELKNTRGIIFWVSVLFFVGVLFGYYVLTPFMVNFYMNYKLSDQITIMPTFSDYLENLIYTTAGIGVLFQMPLLVLLLAKIKVVTAKFLRQYRKYALVVIVILAAVITPSTDPFSLTIVTIPLYGLYEASIILAARANRNDAAKDEEWS